MKLKWIYSSYTNAIKIDRSLILFKIFLQVFLFVLLSFDSFAFGSDQVPIEVGENLYKLELGKSMEVLEDPAGMLTIEDVMSSAYSKKFLPHTKSGFNFGKSPSAFWLRCRLKRNSDNVTPLILAVKRARLFYVDLYVANSKGDIIQHSAHGFHADETERDLGYRFPAFPITQDKDGNEILYLRVQSIVLTFSLTLFSESSFAQYCWAEQFFFGGIFGILIAMIVYNFFIYIVLRDRSYLIYIVYISATLVYISVLSGWPHAYGVSLKFHYAAVLKAWCIATFFGMLFCRTFLMTKRQAPLADRFLIGFCMALIFIFLLDLLGYHILGNTLAYIFGLIAPPVMFIIGLVLWRRGFTPARYYLTAWSIFGIAVLYYALMGMGFLPFTFIGDMALSIGVTGESIFLSFALGDRIRAIRKERRELQKKERRLKEMVIRDELTGLFNRRWFNSRLSVEIDHAKQSKHPLTLIIADVDHFKSYNDSFGHPEGDKALKFVGRIIMDSVRSNDIPCRYGGEEFAIVLPDTDRDTALKIAERIRNRIQSDSISPENRLKRKITLSIGLADLLDFDEAESLTAYSDEALYQAKQSGRNCVKVYEKSEG